MNLDSNLTKKYVQNSYAINIMRVFLGIKQLRGSYSFIFDEVKLEACQLPLLILFEHCSLTEATRNGCLEC